MNTVIAQAKKHLEKNGIDHFEKISDSDLVFSTRTINGMARCQLIVKDDYLSMFSSWNVFVPEESRCEVFELMNRATVNVDHGAYVIVGDAIFFKTSMSVLSDSEMTDDQLAHLIGRNLLFGDIHLPALLKVVHAGMSGKAAYDWLFARPKKQQDPSDSFLNRN